MDKPNRNAATRRRVPPPDDVLAIMSRSELRQRRRVGVDSSRQQRRAIARYREAERITPQMFAAMAAAAGTASAGLRSMRASIRKMVRP